MGVQKIWYILGALASVCTAETQASETRSIEDSLRPGPEVDNMNTLDFNTIATENMVIPDSLQPKIYIPDDSWSGNDLKYIYFSIDSAGRQSKHNFHCAIDEKTKLGKWNIFFPENGRQPTTKEAVQWSCAKSSNWSITKWYMEMFGVRPFDNNENYITAGYADHNTPVQIIDISRLSDTDKEAELPKKYENQKDAFIKNFQKIAENSVGRTLLYRMLIEIRRVNKNARIGAVGTDIPEYRLLLSKRNACRNIKMSWSPERNAFSYSGRYIKFGVQSPTKRLTTISEEHNENYYEIGMHQRSDDVGLVHEVVHWYHFLRHPDRYTTERVADNGLVKMSGIASDGIEGKAGRVKIPIGQYYWPYSCSDDLWKLSAIPWCVRYDEDTFTIGFEEIRTILGIASEDCVGYINGDDISENLYRLCSGQPLRYGHSEVAFYEDASVIHKVIKTSTKNVLEYLDDKREFSEAKCLAKIDLFGKPRYEYTSSVLKSGIGGFKIPKFDVQSIKP